jgi:UDP-N-acetylmuramate--alanine ligase
MSNRSGGSRKRVHLIGVGGIGMSGLARLYLHEGYEVSGSDRSPSALTDALVGEGVRFFPAQKAKNITPDIELVVYTEAMAKEHEEMKAARALGVPMMNYFEALGRALSGYRLTAVAGAHGKTTTTAMLVDILEDAGLDPTAIVGSLRTKTHSNFRAGKSAFGVVEACEYRRDFLHLSPFVLVITNIEYEHVDYYRNLKDMQTAFRALAEKVPENGAVITNIADENVAPVAHGLACRVIDYRPFIDLNLSLRVPGLHNHMNAAAARAAADFFGVAPAAAARSLSDYAGTWRRFEYKGKYRTAPVFDDYAHHPTEITATLGTARALYPECRPLVVFQAHTYSRTHELFDDFARALSAAGEVIITPIYAAREENKSGVSHEALAAAVTQAGGRARAVGSLDETAAAVRAAIRAGDVIIVMGAGDVSRVAGELVES